MPSSQIFKFAHNCRMDIYQGYTVTYVALQLAFHFGFKDVALIGCDHNFVSTGKANMTILAGERDYNHFDPNYFPKGCNWQLPDIIQSEISYLLARNAYEEVGRSIINATEGGKLEIFEKMSLSEFLKL